ncbi:MAG: FHA domain-containing protein [Myxococcales bacterium]
MRGSSPAANPPSSINEHLEVEFEPYVNASAEFVSFLKRLVALKPRDRFSSATAALGFLDTVEEEAAELERLRPPREHQTQHVLKAVRLGDPEPVHTKSAVIWARANSFEGAEGARPWVLHIAGKTYGLHPGAVYVIGRSLEADIVVERSCPRNDTVSRKHARLSVGARGVQIRDLDSANGTCAGSLKLAPGITGLVITEPTTVSFGKVTALLEPWRKK